jgi:hypothetical protein
MLRHKMLLLGFPKSSANLTTLTCWRKRKELKNYGGYPGSCRIRKENERWTYLTL